MSEGCIFCKIVRKEAYASIVFEDSEVMAFMDIRPVSEGHTLIVPKQHFEDVFDTPEGLIATIHKTSKRISEAVKLAINADGISIIQQNGRAAGQEIFHIHVHIIPRFEGHKMPHFGELRAAKREALDEVAERIKNNIKA